MSPMTLRGTRIDNRTTGPVVAGSTGVVIEIVSRAKRLPPPRPVVWESLTQPHRQPSRPWLDPGHGEVEPRVLAADPPERLVWSSLWVDRPRDEIHLELSVAGLETLLRFTIWTPDEHPGAVEAERLRRRLSVLFNEELRTTFGA